MGKSIAEWMVLGEPEIDLHGADVARFYEHHKTREHITARTGEGFIKTYGIIHPGEQYDICPGCGHVALVWPCSNCGEEVDDETL